MLEVNDFFVNYGVSTVVNDVNFKVEEGSIVGLIGGNGAGKTSILRGLSGLISRQGNVRFLNKSIIGLAPWEIVDLGIIHVPQGRMVFPDLTVQDNLELGAYRRKDREVRKDIEKILNDFPILRERAKQKAGTLSGGEQQILAITRAFMSKPKLLLLDEPTLGLAPIMTEKILEVIKSLHQEGLTILLVEQNASFALEASGSAYVMEAGRISRYGLVSELINDDFVRKAYLGV